MLSLYFAVSSAAACLFTERPEMGGADKPEGYVRVMSFNLKCNGQEMEKRYGAAAQTIAEACPDSLGVQEAHVGWRLALDLLLPEHDGVGLYREDKIIIGESSAIYYLRDKYEVADKGDFWISETPDKPSYSWDSSTYRICTWAVLRSKETGFEYAHINTHLDHKGSIAREKGVEMILEKAKEFTDAGTPVVCTGDFNFSEGSSLYNSLTAGVLYDTKYKAADTMSGNTFHGFAEEPINDKKPIDFVLCSDDVSPLTYKIITKQYDGRLPSDHFAIYSDVMF
jgi:endonuclease/exonuclease/phosphatase family metal-dependent hydrolase